MDNLPLKKEQNQAPTVASSLREIKPHMVASQLHRTSSILEQVVNTVNSRMKAIQCNGLATKKCFISSRDCAYQEFSVASLLAAIHLAWN